MDTGIHREINIHGRQWHSLHNGYFGDPDIASEFIEKVKLAVASFGPEVLVDLAGGTGYLLSELIKHDFNPDMGLVNIDFSKQQLARVKDPKIRTFHGSIADFKRSDIDDSSKRFLFIMRSALHYFGRTGLVSLLRHLRSQMKQGEFFVHQTACFQLERDACCLNMIYELMGTEKWYPTIEELQVFMKKTGWSIRCISNAPKLTLTSDELAKRYSLSEDNIARIRKKIIKRYGQIDDVVSIKPGGFCAYLHYKIYMCVAV
jgi:SAM-dependent methyltransferase